MACDQQQDQHGDDLEAIRPPFIGAGGDQGGGEVITGIGDPGRGQRIEHRVQLVDRPVHLLGIEVVERIDEAGDHVGQLLQFVAPIVRYAEQFTDHVHREAVGEPGHHIDGVAGGVAGVEGAVTAGLGPGPKPVEQVGGDGLDPGFERGHGARREQPADESSKPAMPGLIGHQHVGQHQLDVAVVHPVVRRSRCQAVAAIHRDRPPHHLHDLSVAGDDPQPGGPVVEHGPRLPRLSYSG